ncbi:unnamed protein product [Effrenium voratum]|uniref:Uncharacterized protein n=1 Tax=Effrenium voratum TaxID=2562239 RepID=A0AA36MKQ8_9DINO|nr:unnamed protein product [Effrenium voratum]CAJ1442295.1 unnamed protein product [Effrenium voratum]
MILPSSFKSLARQLLAGLFALERRNRLVRLLPRASLLCRAQLCAWKMWPALYSAPPRHGVCFATKLAVRAVRAASGRILQALSHQSQSRGMGLGGQYWRDLHLSYLPACRSPL